MTRGRVRATGLTISSRLRHIPLGQTIYLVTDHNGEVPFLAYQFEDKATAAGPHKLSLDDRSRLNVTGVMDVESFDEQTVVLYTAQGTLIVRGSGLHLKLLSLEGGQVSVDGHVDSLVYEDDAPGHGFFARLFG